MLCRYKRSIFQSENGFCIFSYETADESVPEAARNPHFHTINVFTAVGYNLPATNQFEVDLTGAWQQSKYGLQLAVEEISQKLPEDKAGVLAYLSSGLIKGIGPRTAKAIVDEFGAKSLEIMEQEPDQLLQVKGIAKAKLEKIVRSYRATHQLRDLTTYLAPYGVSLKKIEKIYLEFGADSYDIVRQDPFQLCKIRGFGFLTVDAIARKTNVSLQHPMRYSGAIQYCLDEAKAQGHLFLLEADLLPQCHELLNCDLDQEVVSVDDIKAALVTEQQQDRIYNERGRVYQYFSRLCEVSVAKKVVAMVLDQSQSEIPNLDLRIRQIERTLPHALSPSQRNAVGLCLSAPCAIMTGGPGTGKTTTLKVILDLYHQAFPAHNILLAAPTGKASRRMSEQTGYPASTLHSAMGILCDENIEDTAPALLDADFIVVDECSMVDMRLAYALFARLKPGAKLLLVGDPDQLPAVGPGNVLRDMIRSDMIPTAVLDTVFRQADNSRIALNAYAVNHDDTNLHFGEDFVMVDAVDSKTAAALVQKHFFEEASVHGIENVQILSPFRKRGDVSADSLNGSIRELVNPARPGIKEVKCGTKVYREGDRIIQLKNFDELSNGDVGIITAIRMDEDDEPVIFVRMLDGRDVIYSVDMLEHVDLSYCITIHKSQGAEFPTVIIPLMKEHYIMLRRNLLYTAISRAKGKVILVGQRQAVYMAIHRSDVDKRNTLLADRIVAYHSRVTQRNR